MSVVSNAERMRAIDDAWNAQDWRTYESLLSPSLIAHVAGDAEPHGREEHVARAKQYFAQFPENRVAHEPPIALFAADGWTCSIARLTGKMTLTLKSSDGSTIAPTLRAFDVRFVAVCRWSAGMIEEQYEFFDEKALLQQLGIRAT